MAIGSINLSLLAGLGDAAATPGMNFTAEGRPYLAFDTTLNEKTAWSFHVPPDFASGLLIEVQFSFNTLASPNVCRVSSQIQTVGVGVAMEDSYATLEDSGDVTLPAIAGNLGLVSYAPANTDGIAADSYMSIRLARPNTLSTAEDMLWWSVMLKYTTTAP